VNLDEQKSRLQQFPYQIVVSTPGRLLDLLETGDISLGRVTMLILDEADKMFQLGFNYQLHKIDQQIRPDRQTLLFSATFPPSIELAAQKWLHNPTIRIHVGTEVTTVNSKITQIIHVCAEHKKPRKLIRFIEKIREEEKSQRQKSLILIFANKIVTVKFVEQFLSKNQHRCASLHSEKSQLEREKALTEFKNGKIPVLVATDVAARGLHIPRLPYVINYDFPSNLEQYVHRIGRTGRQDEKGHSYSFFTRNLVNIAPDLVQLLKTNNQSIDPNLLALAKQSQPRADNTENEFEASVG